MDKWLDDITAELIILTSYTVGLKDTTVVKSSGLLNSICFHPDVDVVVCLSFTSLKNDDLYLSTLQDFNKSEEFKILAQTRVRNSLLQAAQPWFTNDILTRMKLNLSLFTSFLKANKNEKRIKFVIASISDQSNTGSSIQLYQNGSLTDPNFQPVSKPPKPDVETSNGKVTLKLSKSPTGETVQFRVEYRMTPSNDSAADDEEWTVIDTSNAQNTFTLIGLKPTEQYWVRYRAVSHVGVSEASDSVPFTFQGNLTVKVDQWNFSIPVLINAFRTEIMTTIGTSRWSPSTIKSEVTNIVNNPIVPYTGRIPGGLREGMALYLQGVVSENFLVVCGDVSLHNGDGILFDFHFRENDLFPGPACNKLPKGSVFDIFFVKSTEGYEMYVNGQTSSKPVPPIPVENISTLHISGGVIMNTVGIVANWSESTFGQEINSGISRRKISDIQCDVPHPVCKPDNPYLGSIPGGLRHGVVLFFQGVVPVDYECFEINLQTGPKNPYDIALQLKPSKDSVVLNSCMNGTWGNEEKAPIFPFVIGSAFDIIMVIKSKCYKVMVNGLEYCKFKHRIPVDKVTTLNIRGDVFMNTFGITKVDDINLNVAITNPANI